MLRMMPRRLATACRQLDSTLSSISRSFSGPSFARSLATPSAEEYVRELGPDRVMHVTVDAPALFRDAELGVFLLEDP